MLQDGLLDVIVRFHDITRIDELQRSLFSVVTQNYRPIQVHLVLQRFSSEAIEILEKSLAPLLAIEGAPRLSLLNWHEEQPLDARCHLLNLGIRNSKGRYIAILDYDDVLYPEAYGLLTSRSSASEAAIVFGGIRTRDVSHFAQFLYVRDQLEPFVGTNLKDLLKDNFCPIHSFIIDRNRVPDSWLWFDTSLTMLEDYDLLLRVCAEFRSDFALLDTSIGEYYYKDDGSNTIANRVLTTQELRKIKAAEELIEKRRRSTALSLEVQRSLGIRRPRQGRTIREYLSEV